LIREQQPWLLLSNATCFLDEEKRVDPKSGLSAMYPLPIETREKCTKEQRQGCSTHAPSPLHSPVVPEY
jgi:hypothetical protein